MYLQASDNFKNAVKSNAITSTARLTFKEFFSDGTDLVIDKNEIDQESGLTLIDFCYNDNTGKLIGTAMTKEVEVKIKNGNNYDLEGKIFDLDIGILVDNEKMTYEYVKYGSYIVTSYEDEKSSKKYKIIAYDLMSKLNEPYIENTRFVFSLPITLKEFYRKFMQSYGIEIEEQTLPNENFVIQNELNFDGLTGRTILGYIAELFGSFAKINRDNKCQMYLKTETDEEIELTQMNTSLEIDKRYGPVNVVSIGLSQVEGENVTLEDGASILANGETTIRIDDNPFVYTEELREQVIIDLFNRLNGFTYVPVNFKMKALLYTDNGDAIKVRNIENNELVETIVLNQKINIPRTRQSTIQSKALTNTAQKNKYISGSKQAQTRTEIMVDKAKQRIEAVVSDLNEAGYGSFSELVQDINGIKTNVGFIADLTKTITGINPITLEECLAGELQYLSIKANNTIFNPLYPNPTLYPNPILFPRGKTYLYIINQKIDENDVIIETTKKIDLDLEKGIRMYSAEVYDEIVYEAVVEEGKPKCKVIRRVGVLSDDTLYELETPFEEPIYIDDIALEEGTNIITFNEGHLGNVTANYVKKNEFTSIFATTYEVNSYITQLADEIDLMVKEKVGKNEIIADLNIAVKDGQGIIQLIGNILEIQADNFKLTKEGDMTANSGMIAGWNINKEYLGKGLAGIKGTANSSSDEDVFYAGKGLGYNGNPAFHVTNQGNAHFKSLSIRGRTANDIGEIKVYNENAQVGSTINYSSMDTYYMVAGNGGTTPTKGKCMHGYDMTHDYRCNWSDGKLYFIIDDFNMGYVTASTSDARLKEDVIDIPQELLYAIEEVELKQFKLTNGNGKYKFGIIAQDLVNAFKKYNLDYKKYEIISEIQLNLKDETLYFTIDYEQVLILKNQLLEDKVKSLENKVEKILNKLGEV